MKNLEKWQKSFIKIWAGQALSLITSAIVQYVIIWYITYKTGSAFWLSMATLVGFVPQGILGLLIGSYIDKRDRKKIMILADSFIGIVSLIMAVYAIFYELPIWLILVSLGLRSVGSAFHDPSLQASMPLIVPEDKLLKYMGYNHAMQSISFIVSPAIAALLYGRFHIASIILIDTIGAIIAVTTLMMSEIPNPKNTTEEKVSFYKESLEGFKIILNNKLVKYLFIISAFFIILFMPVGSLFPLMTISYFGKDTFHAGIVESLFAIGMLIGGLAISHSNLFKNKRRNIIFSMFLIGITTMLSGILPKEFFIAFVILSAIMGFSGPIANSTISTIFAEQIDAAYLGRVYANYMSLNIVVMPIGLLLSGIFADAIGINMWFFITGILTLMLAVVIIFNKISYDK
jgi:DHA3 family macrolide efflux protein-like MFS transporter